MGRRGEPYATDTLLDWINHNGNALPDRERDLSLCCGEIISATTLCSLLQHEGITATVLTGAQAGFLTDDHFGNARIKDVKPERVLKELESHQVVIVTGFKDRPIRVTLRRWGGAEAIRRLPRLEPLRAEMVDIYTDVKGILTADPASWKMRSHSAM